jgi:urease accessory protein UreE
VGTVTVLIQNDVLNVYKPDLQEVEYQRRIQWLKTPPDKVVFLRLNTEGVVLVTSERFLSFSIDSSQIHRGFVNPSLK